MTQIVRERAPARIVKQRTQGPAGPPGPAGEQGPEGPQGAGSILDDVDVLSVSLQGQIARLANLRANDGSALDNPFTGAALKAGVRLPTSRAVTLYNETQDIEAAAEQGMLLRPSVFVFAAEPTDPPELWSYMVRVLAEITDPVTATVAADGSIEVTFTESVTGVTCAGDGTGTLEAYDGTSYAPSVSGSGAVWTLAPPVAGWVKGGVVTVPIKSTIAAAADATRLYDGMGFLLDVAAGVPDEEAPTMTGFVVEATSADATIAISTLSATDNVAVTAYQVNTSATPPDPNTGTWKSAAEWIADGYPSGLTEGANEVVPLYAWAKDAAGNVSTSLSDSCTVTIPHAPSFSVQPTADNKLDGATFSYTVADSLHNVDVQFYDGSTWGANILTNAAPGAKTYNWTGQAGGTKSGCKFRVSDGTTDWVESNVVADFDTTAPTIDSVTPGDTEVVIAASPPAGETGDSYNLLWGTATGNLPNTITGVTFPYTHTGRTNGVEYFYAVVAIKNSATSTQSNEASGTPSNGALFLDEFTAVNGTDVVRTNYWDTLHKRAISGTVGASCAATIQSNRAAFTTHNGSTTGMVETMVSRSTAYDWSTTRKKFSVVVDALGLPTSPERSMILAIVPTLPNSSQTYIDLTSYIKVMVDAVSGVQKLYCTVRDSGSNVYVPTAVEIVDGSTDLIEVVVGASYFKVYYNSVEIFSYTGALSYSAGYMMIGLGKAGTAVDTRYFDDAKVEDAP